MLLHAVRTNSRNVRLSNGSKQYKDIFSTRPLKIFPIVKLEIFIKFFKYAKLEIFIKNFIIWEYEHIWHIYIYICTPRECSAWNSGCG